MRDDQSLPGRPIEPDRLHVTLYHLGNFIDQIPPSLLPSAQVAAESIEMPPFVVTFDRIGGTNGPLLLRPSGGSEGLRFFQHTLSTALAKAGWRRRVRFAFSPHITLSYAVGAIPEQPVDPICWTVRDFVLIESLLDEHRHIIRGSWAIRG